MFKLKLNHLLVIPFVTLISIIVLVFVFLAWDFHKKSTQQLGKSLNEIASPLVQERLTNYLNEAYTANAHIKNAIDKNALFIDEPANLSEALQQVIQKNTAINNLQFAYPDGSYIGIGHTEDGTLVSKVATSTDRLLTHYKLPERTIISEKSDYDARKRDWFKNAGKSAPAWSDSYNLFTHNEPAINLSERIYTKGGQLLGVVASDFLLEDLNQQLSDILMTEHAFIFIVDSDKRLVAQSTNNGSNTSLTTGDELRLQTIDLLSKHSASDQDNLPDNEVFDSVAMNIDGKTATYFINLIPYGQKKGLNWHIGVVIPDSDFLGSINAIKTDLIVILAVIFFTTLLISFLVAYFISRSIQRLQINVDGINSNAPKIYMKNHRIKEIDDLSSSFMRLSHRLRQSYHELSINNAKLEEAINLRTKQLENANKKLTHQSTTDQLTQIANKRAFEEQFDEYWEMLTNGSLSSLAFLICDIDFFKPYNDHYGHLEGDKCIYTVAQTMKSTIGKNGMVSRFGGEEFVIMLPNAGPDLVNKVFKLLQARLAQQQLPHAKSTVSNLVTLSYGASIITTERVVTPEGTRYQLSIPTQQIAMTKADEALYQAKAQGRDRGVLAET